MDVVVHNPDDPVSGFAGIPRNMTGVAAVLKKAGYRAHQIGKWVNVTRLLGCCIRYF